MLNIKEILENIRNGKDVEYYIALLNFDLEYKEKLARRLLNKNKTIYCGENFFINNMEK